MIAFFAAEFPYLPHNNLFRHASYYIRNVFYDNMAGQYADLSEILKEFPFVLLTDQRFAGCDTDSRKKIARWVCLFGNFLRSIIQMK